MISTKPNSEKVINDIDSFIDDLIPSCLNLRIEFEVYVSKNSPKLSIIFNDSIIFEEKVNEGVYSINEKLKEEASNKLIIKMTDKNENETIIENEKIVKDTFILIKDLTINNFKILSDFNFIKNHIEYYVNNNKEETYSGFWKNNSEFNLLFTKPFVLWYTEKTDKNVKSSFILQHRAKDYNQKNFAEEAKLEVIESLKKLKF